jgi:hypothetical protein
MLKQNLYMVRHQVPVDQLCLLLQRHLPKIPPRLSSPPHWSIHGGSPGSAGGTLLISLLALVTVKSKPLNLNKNYTILVDGHGTLARAINLLLLRQRNMNSKKSGVLAMLAVFTLLTVAAVIWSNKQKDGTPGAGQAPGDARPVLCLIGSEKESFFQDPRTIKVLQDNGLTVQYEKQGSREMALRTDLGKYDCAFPAGAPSAMALRAARKVKDIYPVFYTPIVIASWTDLVKPLATAGIVKKIGNTYYIVGMSKLMGKVTKGQRWKDLADNEKFSVSRSIYLSSTDPAKSNSGQMYVALASYVANDDKVVSSMSEAEHVLPLISKLFSNQGYMEASSQGPFADYMTMGMGKAPLVVAYESQFIEVALKNPEKIKSRVLLYPQPTIFTKHILVPLSARGDALGRLMAGSPELRKIAVEYGFRTDDVALFDKTVVAKMPFVPGEILDVAEPPTFEILEILLTHLSNF